jgi:hypothetical protein
MDFSEQLLRIHQQPAACSGPEGNAVILLMAGLALFAALMGALTFVTGPVALAMASLIAGWLLIFAARTVHARRGAHCG